MSSRYLASRGGLLRLPSLSQSHSLIHQSHNTRTSWPVPVNEPLYSSSNLSNGVVSCLTSPSTRIFLSVNTGVLQSSLSSSVTSSRSNTNHVLSTHSLTSVATTNVTLTCSMSTSSSANDLAANVVQNPSTNDTASTDTGKSTAKPYSFNARHWVRRVTPTNPAGVTAKEQSRLSEMNQQARLVFLGKILDHREQCEELFADRARLAALARVTAGEKVSQEELAQVAGYMDHLEQWKPEYIAKIRARINECKRIRMKREDMQQKQKEYYERNRELILARRRQHYAQGGRERVRALARASAARNRERVRAAWKRYYLEHKEKVKARKAEYIRRNRDAFLAKQREAARRQRANMTPEQRERMRERRRELARIRRLLPNPNVTPEDLERARERKRQIYDNYKRRNLEKIKLRTREYRMANREKLREYRRRYAERNREKIRERVRRYRERNRHVLRQKEALRQKQLMRSSNRTERRDAKREMFPRILESGVM